MHHRSHTRFGEPTCAAAPSQCHEDVLAYLALANFHKKVLLKYLSERLQDAIRN